MLALIDGDILLHEIGWSSEFKDEDTKEEILFDTEKVFDLLDRKINIICEESESDDQPILFFTDSEWLANKEKRPFIKGFRYEIAKTRPYKGNRTNPKPFHFYNILVYCLSKYNCIISQNGWEADDTIGKYQYDSGIDNTIICSRDKDLRMVPGLHYSWECGKQRSIGPVLTDDTGWLDLKENGEVIGYGLAFFFYQMLVGDATDNIPGLEGFGTKKAFPLLSSKDLSTEDRYKIVKNLYKEKLGKLAKDYYTEQANLLYIRYKDNNKYVPSNGLSF